MSALVRRQEATVLAYGVTLEAGGDSPGFEHLAVRVVLMIRDETSISRDGRVLRRNAIEPPSGR